MVLNFRQECILDIRLLNKQPIICSKLPILSKSEKNIKAIYCVPPSNFQNIEQLNMASARECVKENVRSEGAAPARALAACLCACTGALMLVRALDAALPEPAHAPAPHQFDAHTAHEHLRNLTRIGPRVAGSYENEVAAVSLLVSTIQQVAAALGPAAHNRVQLDVQRASGAFTLGFMDGMSHVYRHVQSVVVRVSGLPAAPRPRRALLLNCHYDTVPDSPGASDDGAGCAVLLEVMRALASWPHPLRHDVIFLFNGAEENIMQASHAFITQHEWAKSVRAFINVEACGAGGREVLFQAGPHDPWIVEVYAGAVPHPFASSLAQELFESGLIPADTDFRVFRDFGNLSGVDLAWSANGYVYHTRLDTLSRVSPAVLQRTGDNVLALAHGLLASDHMDSVVDRSARQPVYFDVLGVLVVAARAPAALGAAVATAALVAFKLRRTAGDARRQLYVGGGAWASVVVRTAVAVLTASACGVACSCTLAALLHAGGVRLSWYARPGLLAPLYVAPALAATWVSLVALMRRVGAPPLRGWWAARAVHDALVLLAGAVMALCVARGLRSGFLPLLWALLPAVADVVSPLLRVPRALCWALGAALPLLQTLYLQLNSLYMFVPVMGRAGSGPLPPDVAMGALTSAVSLTALSALLPLVVVTRRVRRVAWALASCCACAVLLVLASGPQASYSPARPMRLMLFHTRRTVHSAVHPTHVRTFYWVPELDANTRAALNEYVGRGALEVGGAGWCHEHLYCGAPYYLPVMSRVARSYALSVPHAPLPRLHAQLSAHRLDESTRIIHVNVTRGAPHVVLVVAPPPGAVVSRLDTLQAPAAGARWGPRVTYFVSLHSARGPAAWNVTLELRGPTGPTHVSLAAHAMSGPQRLHAEHDRLVGALPSHVAATGWGVDLHLYTL